MGLQPVVETAVVRELSYCSTIWLAGIVTAANLVYRHMRHDDIPLGNRSTGKPVHDSRLPAWNEPSPPIVELIARRGDMHG
jgi:hypothetical protein